jgi:hypothetical protein
MWLVESKIEKEGLVVGNRIECGTNSAAHLIKLVTFCFCTAYKVIKSFFEILHAGIPEGRVDMLSFPNATIKVVMAAVKANPVPTCTKHIREKWNTGLCRLRKSCDTKAYGGPTGKN